MLTDAFVMLGNWSRENAYRSPTISEGDLLAIADLDSASLAKLGREIGTAEERCTLFTQSHLTVAMLLAMEFRHHRLSILICCTLD